MPFLSNINEATPFDAQYDSANDEGQKHHSVIHVTNTINDSYLS